MPNWGEILSKVETSTNPFDEIRSCHLKTMFEYTGRNVIAYYSAFIQKQGLQGTAIDDNDKNAFMQAVCGLDKSLGLDLLIHTPGGNLAAAESIVYYLKKLFGNDIRVFVPQIAMSAGTMIALSAKQIVMGKQSNLGPIDPQFGGVSCAGIVEEFEEALADVVKFPEKARIWGAIIGKYHPTFVGDCKKAIEWADTIVKAWLIDNMFRDVADREQAAQRVLDVLSSHNVTFSHSRHIHMDELRELGLNVIALEGLDDRTIGDCKDLQDCVLTIHHSYMHAISNSSALKIVENHIGEAMVVSAE